jgi:hypothetical protein
MILLYFPILSIGRPGGDLRPAGPNIRRGFLFP